MRRAAFLAGILFSAPVQADEQHLLGTWAGEYTCNQGLTGLTLTISEAESGKARALFHFYESPENPGVPEGCFVMQGTYDPATGMVGFTGEKWLLRPDGYHMVDLSGKLDEDGARFTGNVTPELNCTTFLLDRVTEPRPTPIECSPSQLLASIQR